MTPSQGQDRAPDILDDLFNPPCHCGKIHPFGELPNYPDAERWVWSRPMRCGENVYGATPEEVWEKRNGK
jgi:hypothetical protein